MYRGRTREELLQEAARVETELKLHQRLRELREATERMQDNGDGESADFKAQFKSEAANDDVVFVTEQQAPHRRAAAGAATAEAAATSNMQHMQALPFANQYNAPEAREQRDAYAMGAHGSQAMPEAMQPPQYGFGGPNYPQANVQQPNLQQGGLPQDPQGAAAMGPPPTPASRRRRPSETPESEKRVKKPKMDFRPPHDNLPSVVRAPDGIGYVELRCCFCGGNHSTKHRAGAFFKGAAGLANHIRICHFSKWPEKSGGAELSNFEVVRLCSYRHLDNNQVDQMVRGNKKAIKIQQVDADGNAEAGTMVTRPRQPRAGKRKAKDEAKDEAAEKEQREMTEAAEALMSLRKKPRYSATMDAQSSEFSGPPSSSPLQKQSQMLLKNQEDQDQDGMQEPVHANGGLSTPKPESADGKEETDGDEDEDEDQDDSEDDGLPREPVYEWPRKTPVKGVKPVEKVYRAARKSAPGGPSALY